MTAPKGFTGIRTVTLPLAIWRYTKILAFAGLWALIAMAALGGYCVTVLANRPEVPLLAPDKASTVTTPHSIKP